MLYARCLDYNDISTLKLSACDFSTKGILFNSNFFQSSFARILRASFWWAVFGGLYFSYFSIIFFRKIQLWLLQSKRVKTVLQTVLEKNSYKKPVSIKQLLLGSFLELLLAKTVATCARKLLHCCKYFINM